MILRHKLFKSGKKAKRVSFKILMEGGVTGEVFVHWQNVFTFMDNNVYLSVQKIEWEDGGQAWAAITGRPGFRSIGTIAHDLVITMDVAQ